MRRYLIVGAAAVVILGIAAAAYFAFFRGSSGIVVAPPDENPFASGGAGLPSAPGDTGSASSTAGAAATSSAPVVVASGAEEVAARLLEVDPGPVVPGVVAFDAVSTSTGSTTREAVIAYLSRQSGNVFAFHLGTRTLVRTSNRTIPGIEEAAWLPSGATAYVRYLSGDDASTINTYALPASGAGGFFLPQDIASLSAGASSLLYLSAGANGTIGTLVRADGSAPAQAFTTPLSQVRAAFAGKEYLVFTKPSAAIPGYAFLVAGGSFTEVAGPLDGLVALPSPQGDYALVSYSSAGVLKMELLNLKTLAALPLPVATIADKCAWSADESSVYCGVPTAPSASYAYPDDWYQGAVHFSDRLWRIDVAGRFAELVDDVSVDAGTPVDAADLALDPEARVLTFLNRTDGSLWAYQL
jgi:hypothetical protein